MRILYQLKYYLDYKKTVATLNDLLKITNDRIQGFSKVEEKVWDHYLHLKNNYEEMIRESQTMKSDLLGLITNRGGIADDTSTTAGALNRTWIDLKNSFSGDNSEATLENVMFGEKAAIRSYQAALDSGDLCSESTFLVASQLEKLKSSYNKFSSLERNLD
ncbi:PA2169 family four-helix-bundle protein [Chryseobacterium sp. 09-1422]|uniref:PA2169 family four-helix-bundle protein n=1 Tax=Chryseobacterium kimseyorum TaxID=2984028 RepID=A0ABT3I463_9FLAO|nr:PA2169 family four-helix-bundle protein [Chryseobacterium kimseyorum]MCW3170823.1 PA2169 family four-helix-bundle protein [Chryseobacterium kimseyorum]